MVGPLSHLLKPWNRCLAAAVLLGTWGVPLGVRPLVQGAESPGTQGALLAVQHHVSAATTQAEPLLKRLGPETRAKVLMALLGLVLVGLGLVALIWLGGRYMRRVAGQRSRPTDRHEDDWYRKPLNPPDVPSSGVREPE